MKKQTSDEVASTAGKILSSDTATAKAKSIAGSALAQTVDGGEKETTSKEAASIAGEVLSSDTASDEAKSVAGSTLAQRQ